MRVLVCGGRDFNDRKAVFAGLDYVHSQITIGWVIAGGAKGADKLAIDWAKARNVPFEEYLADWGRYKLAAGPIRNATMLREGRPHIGVAFPGGRGTADMTKKLEKAGLRVIRMDRDGQVEGGRLWQL